MDCAVPCCYPLDVFHNLWVVDTLERLGISRYFQEEIEFMLSSAYRYMHTKIRDARHRCMRENRPVILLGASRHSEERDVKRQDTGNLESLTSTLIRAIYFHSPTSHLFPKSEIFSNILQAME